MTYRELLMRLSSLPTEALDQDVTVVSDAAGSNEYYPITGYGVEDGVMSDVLDPGHFFLMTEGTVV